MEKSAKVVEEVIERFVGEISGLIKQIEVDNLTGALSQASSRLRAELPGKAIPEGKKETKSRAILPASKAPSSTPGKSRAAKKTSTSSTSNKGVVTEASTPAKARRPVSSPGRAVVTGDEPKAAVVGEKPRPSKKAIATPAGMKNPSSEKGSADLASRDAAVLEAIRVLGEPDAATVAKHIGRSKTASYMAAQRLIEEGKLVKITSGRTILYRLAPSSAPTKRIKTVKVEPKGSESGGEPDGPSIPRGFGA